VLRDELDDALQLRHVARVDIPEPLAHFIDLWPYLT
jgi:hypothetical protein